MNAPLTALLADPSVCPEFKRAVASSPAMDRAEAAIALNARTQTADLLVGTLIRLTAEQQHVDPAFREGLTDSPALRRAEAAMAARAWRVRSYHYHSIKLGAEVILTDLANGNPNTFRRALQGVPGSVPRRQAALAMAWRDRFGTRAKLPTRRMQAMARSMRREGGAL